MKKILLSVGLLISLAALAAEVKLSDLPLGSAPAVGANDSFPYVDSGASVTRRLKLSQLLLTPTLATPTFTGGVTAPSFTGDLFVPAETASTVPYLDGSKQLVSSAVTPAELGYLSGVSSAIQTQLNGKQATGSYITSLTGDVTATGPGASAAAVALVGGSTAANVNTATIAANAADPNDVAGTIVKRDAFGDFSSSVVGVEGLQVKGLTSGLVNIIATPTTTTHTLTLPAAQGAASTVLTNDGSGVLSWGTASANTALSNLTATSINQDLIPDGDATRDLGSVPLRWDNLFSSNVASGSVATEIMSSAAGTQTFQILDGASVFGMLISSDDSALTATRPITIKTGAASDPSTFTTGILSLASGDSNSLSSSGTGAVLIQSGEVIDPLNAGSSGAVSLKSGPANGGGSSGALLITSGYVDGAAVTSGDVDIKSGNAFTTSNSGNVSLITGSSSGGTRGIVLLDGIKTWVRGGPLSLRGSSSGFVDIQAPAAPTSYAFSLPSVAPTTGQVLVATSASTTSWATPSGIVTYTTQTGNYVALAADQFIRMNAAGTPTVTLPLASANLGRVIEIKNVHATGVVTISGDTIDGSASISLPLQYQSVTLVAGSASEWNIL